MTSGSSSRRRIAATAGVVATSLVLAACGGGDDGDSGSGGGGGGGTLTIGTTDKITFLDPAGSNDNGSFAVINQAFPFLLNNNFGRPAVAAGDRKSVV